MDVSETTQKLIEFAITYGLNIVSAVIIFIVGRWVAKAVTKFMGRVMTRNNVDETLIKFVGNLCYVALLALVVVAALSKLGIQTASFVAILGAAGLAIGLALQGSLSNFAAGVLMIIFRPFQVGHYIEAAGVEGSVEEIQIFTTQLKTTDNKTVIVPNATVMANVITNYSDKDTRRVDMVFGIGYDDDIDKARAIINEIISSDERVLKEPDPKILVSELADSSVNFSVRAWTKSDDYWGFYFDTIETVKKRFDQEGISIPFPQRDVHIYQETVSA